MLYNEYLDKLLYAGTYDQQRLLARADRDRQAGMLTDEEFDRLVQAANQE